MSYIKVPTDKKCRKIIYRRMPVKAEYNSAITVTKQKMQKIICSRLAKVMKWILLHLRQIIAFLKKVT